MRFKGRYSYVFLALLSLLVACQGLEEPVSSDGSLKLSFSNDAIILDTVFTDLTTPTYRFSVYNKNSKNVRIRRITLQGGSTSPYRVIINGKEGSLWENVLLRAGDSLRVLVSATLPGNSQNQEPELFYDELLFETNSNQQKVPLISWGQTVAHISGTIACDAVWDAGRPYILYDSVSVAPGCSLTIEAGARVYAYNRAALHVFGTLIINGTPADSVVIGGFRQEPLYERAVGTWRGLLLYPGTGRHLLNYCTLRNAEIGILCSDTEVDINACQIYHASVAGCIAFNTQMRLYNTIISNCIERLFQANDGGSYELVHCTFANYEYNFFRNNEPGTVFFQNDDAPPMSISLFNSVFWGSLSDEIFFIGPGLSLQAAHNVFKTATYSAEVLNPGNNQNQVNPSGVLFQDERALNLRPAENSPLIDRGLPTSITNDIEGLPRDNQPDIGAFEYRP
ncbi:choice-of-anchor Q domain-containing protein [Thermonema rossianum]|uniref:choice-of-anchor Q domain-containing protein n=1 Tax=Thermonema rossianum TaxID=55505 RepID=UPI00056DF094|nr:choice-of-anchor Q domain-containing protein [Thermonema rossianum]